MHEKLALVATGLFLVGILGTVAGALWHHRLPRVATTLLEAEWWFSILGGLFGVYLFATGATIELPLGEIITVTTVTTVGAVVAFLAIRTGWVRKINDRIPHNLLVFLTVGILPLLGSLVGEPAAAIVTSALLFGVFHALPESKKYQLMSGLFATIAIGGLFSTFAAPPVAIAAHRWHLSAGQLREMFLIPVAIAMILQGLYAAWITRGVQQARAAEDPQVRFGDFWPIGPKTGMFLIGIVLLANYASPVLGQLAFSGEHWQVFVKTGLLTNISDNGGLAEAAVTYLPHATTAEVYWVLGATLSWAVGTLIANAPNIVVAMMLARAFSHGHVNFVKQSRGAAIPLLINVVVFGAWGALQYGLFGS